MGIPERGEIFAGHNKLILLRVLGQLGIEGNKIAYRGKKSNTKAIPKSV